MRVFLPPDDFKDLGRMESFAPVIIAFSGNRPRTLFSPLMDQNAGCRNIILCHSQMHLQIWVAEQGWEMSWIEQRSPRCIAKKKMIYDCLLFICICHRPISKRNKNEIVREVVQIRIWTTWDLVKIRIAYIENGILWKLMQRIMRTSKIGIRDTLWEEEKIGVYSHPM